MKTGRCIGHGWDRSHALAEMPPPAQALRALLPMTKGFSVSSRPALKARCLIERPKGGSGASVPGRRG